MNVKELLMGYAGPRAQGEVFSSDVVVEGRRGAVVVVQEGIF